jgi:hypothetical protein
LKFAIQALALPSDIQLQLFPNFGCTVDELALDFDHWYDCIIQQSKDKLTHRQIDLLVEINHSFEQMSGTERSELWSKEALETSKEWAEIRKLAKQTLEAFSWPLDVPPVDRAIYIPGKPA